MLTFEKVLEVFQAYLDDDLQLSPYNITQLHCIIHTLPVECCYMQFS